MDFQSVHYFTASAGGKWANAFNQGEIYILVKKDRDPPASIYHSAAPIQITGDGLGHYFPRWDDGYIWTNFGRDRINIGNPTTDLSSSFRTYNLVVSQSLYSASIDNELFYSSSANITPYFTDSNNGGSTTGGAYWIGRIWSGGFPMTLQGNIAAIYFYNKKLSDSERTQVKTYINSTWGTSLV
jgi:hypothetical protein